MIGEAVEIGSKLTGSNLILYVLMLGLFSVIFYLLKAGVSAIKAVVAVLKEGIKESNENAKLLAGIHEQLDILVTAAITGRKNND